ncbi:MAG TPA: patatin-like phospholipase family protein [Candidatus Acidoferrales bacterium]|nr:patatin-like phospholipase family protein [Candidatus Acidoferrales bacterium]
MGDGDNWLGEAVKKIRAFAHARRSAKPAGRPRVGLALGGGFARGIAHLGVLRVLKEERIPIDYLAGTSVGALIAAAYAGGSSLDEMERISCSTRFKDFAEWTISWQGLASDTRLEAYLKRLTPMRWFEDLKIPLTIAATDLMTAEPVYFSSGEIGPALCASCAYPGLFRPVAANGRLLVDGFLAAPVPVEAARAMGADIVIAVNLSGLSAFDKPTNLFETISRSFAILMRYAESSWRPLADVVIEPAVNEFRWDDFPRTPELVAAGQAAARAALPQILRALQPTKPQPEAVSAPERIEEQIG